MTKISGFTFIHNALIAGYPVFEAISVVAMYVDELVVVDMESDDGTRELLDYVAATYRGGECIKVVDGEWWPGKAGKCLSYNHSLHAVHCTHDVIWHFEADEVYSDPLASYVWNAAAMNHHYNLAVWRLQVEQNFQRVRWYPEPVHRMFPKGSVAKSGHTTTRHQDAQVVSIENGFLWDVTNCFRDQWEARIIQQAELWGGQPQWNFVPLHFKHSSFYDNNDAVVKRDGTIDTFLSQPHWTWKTSPLKLPTVLQSHVGETRYHPHLEHLGVKEPEWLKTYHS